MRTKDTLFDFDKVAILLQYLYMSEEHKILIHNVINVPLEIYMITDKADNSIHIMCKNLNFPDLEPMVWDDVCSPNTLLNIVYNLMKEDAVEFPQTFKNRWEEIETMTKHNLVLNEFNMR